MKEQLLAKLYDIITENKREMFDRIAAQRTNHMTVVMENIFQEHNASAVLRSCDCFGIQDLHVIEKDYKYKVQRDIALGAGRWVNMHQYHSSTTPTVECLNALKKQGYRIVATTPHEKSNTIHDLNLDKPFALVFGTERRGISQDVIDHADEFVSIPMYGFTESFNISVSAAIVLNTLRGRLENSTIDWKFSDIQQTELKIQWCKYILNGGEAIERQFTKDLLALENAQ